VGYLAPDLSPYRFVRSGDGQLPDVFNEQRGLDFPPYIRWLLPFVVKIETPHGMGTGTVFCYPPGSSLGGWCVLTCAHVLHACGRFADRAEHGRQCLVPSGTVKFFFERGVPEAKHVTMRLDMSRVFMYSANPVRSKLAPQASDVVVVR
jgi:hypothetical protein